MSVDTRVGIDRRGIGLLAVTVVCWGLNWPAMKYLVTVMPPFSARAAATLLGAAIAFGLAAVLGEALWPPRGQWGALVVSALLNYVPFIVLATIALQLLAASETVIVFYTLPIWSALFAWPLLGEAPTKLRLGGLLLGLSGVVVLMTGRGVDASWDKLPGFAAALAGSLMFGLGVVVSKRRPVRMPPLAGIGWQVLIATAPMLPLAGMLERPDWAATPKLAIAAAMWIAVMGMVLAYVCWFAALRRLSAAVAAMGTLLVPMVGAFSSALLLGEPMGPRELAALGLTLGGVALALRG